MAANLHARAGWPGRQQRVVACEAASAGFVAEATAVGGLGLELVELGVGVGHQRHTNRRHCVSRRMSPRLRGLERAAQRRASAHPQPRSENPHRLFRPRMPPRRILAPEKGRSRGSRASRDPHTAAVDLSTYASIPTQLLHVQSAFLRIR